MSSSQTALVLDGISAPLKKVTLPIPTPKGNQVLLKVTAAGLNAMDQKIRDHNIWNLATTYPSILAFDVVGVVISNGPDSSLPPGTHVFARSLISDPASGGLQGYTVVDGSYAIPVPPNLSDLDASTYPINAFTVGAALFAPDTGFFPLPGTPESETFDYADATLVIVGGGTNTGSLAVQFARIAGIGSIVAVASLSSAETLKRLGATHIVDRRADDVIAEVRQIVHDDCVCVLDAYNTNLSLSLSILSNTRRGALVHLVPQATPDEDVVGMKTAGFERRTVFGEPERYPLFAGVFNQRFVEWLVHGRLKMPEYEVIRGLDGGKVDAALDAMRDGTARVKWAVEL
ncbi:chaperonin 10-like protein [Delphinella strobiligena]|nr:chaperonin 10-like protein [Delphinella strobiligena]